MIIAYIDTGDLLEVIVVSLVAGIGCTAAFGLAILGGTRAIDFGRVGRAAAATVYGALGALAMAVVVAAIAVGIVAMVDK
jgi:hypothetical protein